MKNEKETEKNNIQHKRAYRRQQIEETMIPNPRMRYYLDCLCVLLDQFTGNTPVGQSTLNM